ncbi:HAD family hydrolase [Bifidobacterium tissieri]|uniref:HAD family phosphatase n=1 Tax=Bifidobacterium tissieri TaxID=1630162 RepID=A0A5M9ZPK3_9BIFI|nr:HAD family phosphatase [Bifidobacterium tissieri]KAA8829438.1 HAD family phosphatase [Bifidobacterium tissieri]KAA8831399.1 HAD family phosphatase [Bifidobacterium tissieri]
MTAISRPLPKAVLWDLDGTLVNSDPLWTAAERECVTRHGGTWTDAIADSLAGASLTTCAQVLRNAGVPLSDDEIIPELVHSVVRKYGDSVPWVPGAVKLLTAFRDAGVPSVLVTGSPRVLAERVLAAAPEGAFVGCVTGDDDVRDKPDPEPYVRGASLANAEPGECVAFEDSAAGLASAIASGAYAVAVRAHARTPIPDASDHITIASLADVTVRTDRYADRLALTVSSTPRR